MTLSRRSFLGGAGAVLGMLSGASAQPQRAAGGAAAGDEDGATGGLGEGWARIERRREIAATEGTAPGGVRCQETAALGAVEEAPGADVGAAERDGGDDA